MGPRSSWRPASGGWPGIPHGQRPAARSGIYPASEKLEIIRLVEQSHLPAGRTLEKLGIVRSTFYRWYDRYQAGGLEALEDRPSTPRQVWNRIPDEVRERIAQRQRARLRLRRTGKMARRAGYGACSLRAQSSSDPGQWYQTLKNRIFLENYYLPGDLEACIIRFVDYYNHQRFHESLKNLTPANVYFGRGQTILMKRERIKRDTIQNRRLQHQRKAA
jgi:transposase-like protein